MKTEEPDLREALSQLNAEDRKRVEGLHEYALSLGCTLKCSAMEKNKGWKCEYFLKKKQTLFIVRVTDARWSIRCKLFHIADYTDVLEQCGNHCKETLLANAQGCGSHGGGCAGPVSFTLGGRAYSKCRHSLLFDNLTDEDIGDLQTLLKQEKASAAGFSSGYLAHSNPRGEHT
jgi:hypothetical protein